MDKGSSDQIDVIALRQLLATRFSVGELQNLCFDFKIDYDDLPGQTRVDKARELVAFAMRRQRTAELVSLAYRFQPDADWSSVAPNVVLAPASPGGAAPESAELNATDFDQLANILLQSGYADHSRRTSLCLRIQVESRNLSFIDQPASSDFALQLIYHLHQTDNIPALLRLCDAMNGSVHGTLATQLAAIRVKVAKLK